ncbi:hypothetical protein GT50_15890 [Geobacillus stearothermophilus 10]|nr:hypothetical protein GT50_15890 [Geobacillus stearothermophilus 10]
MEIIVMKNAHLQKIKQVIVIFFIQLLKDGVHRLSPPLPWTAANSKKSHYLHDNGSERKRK